MKTNEARQTLLGAADPQGSLRNEMQRWPARVVSTKHTKDTKGMRCLSCLWCVSWTPFFFSAPFRRGPNLRSLRNPRLQGSRGCLEPVRDFGSVERVAAGSRRGVFPSALCPEGAPSRAPRLEGCVPIPIGTLCEPLRGSGRLERRPSFAPRAIPRQSPVQALEPVMHFVVGHGDEGQRPGNKPAQGKRGTSAALGVAFKKDKALKGRRTLSRRFRALSVWDGFPRALPWAGMLPGLWPSMHRRFQSAGQALTTDCTDDTDGLQGRMLSSVPSVQSGVNPPRHPRNFAKVSGLPAPH